MLNLNNLIYLHPLPLTLLYQVPTIAIAAPTLSTTLAALGLAKIATAGSTHCTALHVTALHVTVLHCTALNYT